MLDQKKTTLGYFAPSQQRPSRHAWLWAVGGILAGLPLLAIAVLAGGGGHGSYVPLMLFFPFSSLLMNLPVLSTPEAQPVMIVLAMLQYPVYGILMYFAERRRIAYQMTAILGVLHLAAIVVALVAASLTGGQ